MTTSQPPQGGQPPGPYEVLSSGKGLSRIHRSWLGPERFTLPWPIPYVAAGAFLVSLLPAIGLAGLIGVPGLWHYGTAIVLAGAVGWLASRNSSSDRPMLAVLGLLRHELSAPRPPEAPTETPVLGNGAEAGPGAG